MRFLVIFFLFLPSLCFSQKADVNSFASYPNPFYEQLTIEIIGNDNYQSMELSDATGKIIRTKIFDNEADSQTFEVGHLNSGLYFVRFIGSNKVQVVKAIKAGQ